MSVVILHNVDEFKQLNKDEVTKRGFYQTTHVDKHCHDDPTMNEQRLTQTEALERWGDDAKLCPECLNWKHKRDFHLDTCQSCLRKIYQEVFVDRTRPLAITENDEQFMRHDVPRPKEWPTAMWYGRMWKSHGDQGKSWRLTEDELYNSYVAIIEGDEAFLAELKVDDMKHPKAEKAIALMLRMKLIKRTRKGLDYREDWE